MPNYTFLDAQWNPVKTAAEAEIVKVIYEDGRVTFGIPKKQVAKNSRSVKSYFGKPGRPGNVGGSLPRLAGVAVKTVPINNGQINEVMLLTLDNGQMVVEKSISRTGSTIDVNNTPEQAQREAENEVVAYKLSRLFTGVNVPKAIMMGTDTVRSEFLEGAMNGSDLTKSDREYLAQSEAGIRAGVFDFITCQGDRHNNNWMFTPKDKKIWLIDNGNSFSEAEADENWYPSKSAFITSTELRLGGMEGGYTNTGKAYPEDMRAGLEKVAADEEYPSGYRTRAKALLSLGQLPDEETYRRWLKANDYTYP